MRLALIGFLLLLTLPATASAAELTLELDSPGGVQFGQAHRASGVLTDAGVPQVGQAVEIQRRLYPYTGKFRRIATVATGPDGSFAIKRKFDRNAELQAFAPAQQAASPMISAHVFPRPSSYFKALAGNRLRITQYLRTPRRVKLTAPSIFYLGPKSAKTAPRVAKARPRRVSRGRFKATAVVDLPRAWKGAFRYGSCFRYSEGSGLGDPDARCPRRYRF
jgi:hypothetical protein